VVVNKSLAEGIVTEDLAENAKAYKTSEVGGLVSEAYLNLSRGNIKAAILENPEWPLYGTKNLI